VTDAPEEPPPRRAVGREARNEKRKLLAVYLNNTAVALFVAGLIAPYFAFITPHITFQGMPSFPMAAVWISLSLSVVLHLIARGVLSKLED
jgi:hypothetical protein